MADWKRLAIVDSFESNQVGAERIQESVINDCWPTLANVDKEP